METELNTNELMSNSKIITVHTVIDTDRILREIGEGSNNSATPKYIDHKFAYMVAANANNCIKQGTGDLEFEANIGDIVRMYAVSGSGNFEDEALLYEIKYNKGETIFAPFIGQLIKGKEIMFPESSTNPIKTTKVKTPFWFYQTSITDKGKEQYDFRFSIYTQENNAYKLRGYYAWDPAVTVK